MTEKAIRNVLRSEKKYLITLDQYYRYSGLLRQIMREDEHNSSIGYPVRSLYFDTPEDGDFFDKQNGLETRRKVRLRVYGPDSDFALLEMKQKQGENQRKRSLRLERREAARMCAADYGALLREGTDSDFAAECFGLMQTQAYRPKAVVEYHRTAFLARECSIRVTFDRDVRATESCTDLFSHDLCLYPVFPSSLVVMEVKYNGFLLSYIKDALNGCEKNELSVSKYCLGRTVGLHYDFI